MRPYGPNISDQLLSSSADANLHVGFSRRDITPPLGTRLVGYLDRSAVSDRHDSGLSVTGVALRGGGATVVLVACDVIGMPLPVACGIRRDIASVLELPDRAVWLVPSHTHSAPSTVADPYASAAEREWIETLRSSLMQAARDALAATVPATVRLAAFVNGTGVNRRRLDDRGEVEAMAPAVARPVEHQALVAAFEAGDGSPIGVILQSACHPTACGRDTRYVSADYPGSARVVLEAAGFGPCAFLLGACADANPLGGIQADPAHADALGRSLGHAAVAALADAEPAEVTAVRLADASVPVTYEVTGDRDGYDGLGLPGELTTSELQELASRRFPWESPVDAAGRVDVEVGVIAVGDLVLASIPFEVFAATGARLRRAAGGALALATVANGTVGYLPPRDELPRGGYEVTSSHLLYRLPGPPPADAEERVVDTVSTLLAEISR